MHNQDHSNNSNLGPNSSLSMRLLNPQTNFNNTSMNYSLIGYNTHPNNLHPSFQGNNTTYQSNSLWTLNEHADNNPNNNNNISTSINGTDNNFGMSNYQQFSHSIAFSQQATNQQQQPPRQHQQQQQQNPQQQQQRLKVEDALNYLDQVKLQFGHQPQIYNDFLDIMKEFKLHSIDTTGVIMRVSRLFRGHPELIVGFNTFLPPGYNIEVHENETIQVYQPGHQVLNLNINNFDDDGTAVVQRVVDDGNNRGGGDVVIGGVAGTGGCGNGGVAGGINSNIVVGIVNNAVVNSGQNNNHNDSVYNIHQHNNNLNQAYYQHSNHQYPHHNNNNNNQAPPQPPSSLGLNSTNLTLNSGFPRQKHHHEQAPAPQAPAAAASAAATATNAHAGHSSHPPVEFNHAISYVNKIKNCYQDKPEIYKAFLDILHNYQKEQKSLKEAQQKNLNPASTTRRAQITEAEVYSQVSVLFKDQPDLLREFRQFLPDATHPMGEANNKTHRQSLMSLGASAKSSQQLNATSTAAAQVSPRSSDWNPPHKKAKFDLVDKYHDLFTDPDLTRAVDRAHGQGKEHLLRELLKQLEALKASCITPKEFHHSTSSLLEKLPEIKQLLHTSLSKEFKLWNVPTQTSTVADTDVHKVSKERKHEKKVKATAAAVLVATVAAAKNHANVKEEKRWYLDLSTCKRVGKSYRLLPSKYLHEVASSRGALEKEVLNDRYALYPHCDSEGDDDDSAPHESSSVRRNGHEDHVFQCEDERYELDMVIDLNASILRELTRLASRMHKMTSEELAKFQVEDLQATLGVSNVHIETVFKRLYGDKHVLVLEGLRRCPRATVPIAIRSLGSKDVEWRGAKRQFERVWSEQVEKHYLRSLDQQGLKFKQTDAKAIRSKSLIKEVLPSEEEEDEKEEGAAPPPGNDPPPRRQFSLPYPHQSAYQDAVSLVWSGIQRQSNVGADEMERMRYLLDHLIPSILFNHNPPPDLNLPRDDDGVVEGAAVAAAAGGGVDDDAEKKVTAADKKGVADGDVQGGGGGGVMVGKEEDEKKEKRDKVKTFKPPSAFICNENWYVCLRLLLLLCQRLHVIRGAAEAVVKQEESFRALRSDLSQMALSARLQEATDPRQHYPHFLAMVTSLMAGTIDSASFEDSLRELLGVHCYVAFTLDKLVHNVVRQLQHTVSKDESFSVQEEYLRYLRGCGGEEEEEEEARVAQWQTRVEALLVEKMAFKYHLDVANKRLNVHLLPARSQQQQQPEGDSDNNNNQCNNDETSIQDLCQVKNEVKCERDASLVQKRVNRFQRTRSNARRREAVAVWSGIPDFYRKFRRRQKLPPLDEPSTQTCIMQALNTLALAHAKSSMGAGVVRPAGEGGEEERLGGGVVNNVEAHFKGGDALVTKARCTEGGSREEFKSQDGSEANARLNDHCRSRIKLSIDTTTLVCRPQSFASARREHKRKTLGQLRRFERWMDAWLLGNTTKDGVSSVMDWLQGVLSDDVPADNNKPACDAMLGGVVNQESDVSRNCDASRRGSFDRRLKRRWHKVLVDPDTHAQHPSSLCHSDVASRDSNQCHVTKCSSPDLHNNSNSLIMKRFNYDSPAKLELNKNELINECINALAKNDPTYALCNNNNNTHHNLNKQQHNFANNDDSDKCINNNNNKNNIDYSNNINRPPYRFYHKYRLSSLS